MEFLLNLVNLGNFLLVTGLTLIIGLFILLNHHRYKVTEYVGTSVGHCSNPDCVRCIAKERLNSAIQKRMECLIVSNLSVNSDVASNRLRRSFEHYLSVSKLKEDFDNNYTKVGAGHLQIPSVFFMEDLCEHHSLKGFANNFTYRHSISTLKFYFLEVREEFCNLWKQFGDGKDQTGWQENSLSNNEGNWFAFHLINQGKLISDNLDRCPVTSKVLDQLGSQLMKDCIFGFATFSVIMPGTHISSHCGATNVRARCHLGLVIPEGCTLVVNQEELKWVEGDCLVFDDSFQHEVYHTGESGPRCVFMVDLWHPALSADEQKGLNRVFHTDMLKV